MARASTASAGRVPAATNFGLPDKALRLLQEIRWIAVFVLGLFLAVILATYDREDPGWSHSVNHAELANGGGRVGAWFADFLLYQFGTSAWLLVVLLVIAAWRGLRAERARRPDDEPPRLEWERWLGFGLFFLGCSMLEASRLHSAAFEVPLAFLMDPRNHQRRRYDVEGATRTFFAMPWGPPGEKPYFIWGATAAMLRNLYHFLRADR